MIHIVVITSLLYSLFVVGLIFSIPFSNYFYGLGLANNAINY